MRQSTRENASRISSSCCPRKARKRKKRLTGMPIQTRGDRNGDCREDRGLLLLESDCTGELGSGSRAYRAGGYPARRSRSIRGAAERARCCKAVKRLSRRRPDAMICVGTKPLAERGTTTRVLLCSKAALRPRGWPFQRPGPGARPRFPLSVSTAPMRRSGAATLRYAIPPPGSPSAGAP
jgi:hypothetical protein